MFIPIQKILPKSIRRLGLTRQTEAALICEKYRKLAPRLIHTNALQHTFPKFYRGRALTIGVENSAWAAQVVARKEELMKIMNEELGKQILHNVKTQVVEKIPEGFSARI